MRRMQVLSLNYYGEAMKGSRRPVWERSRPTIPAEEPTQENPYKVEEYLDGWWHVTYNGKRVSPQGWRYKPAAQAWAWEYWKMKGNPS